jgi:hypothetical protein
MITEAFILVDRSSLFVLGSWFAVVRSWFAFFVLGSRSWFALFILRSRYSFREWEVAPSLEGDRLPLAPPTLALLRAHWRFPAGLMAKNETKNETKNEERNEERRTKTTKEERRAKNQLPRTNNGPPVIKSCV